MLMATAFLLLAEVPDAVDLLCRDVAGSLGALRLQLQNEPASRETSLNFYERLRLLIDEQGSTETLIQQLTSGQAAMTAEYDGGTRIMEQFLRAVAYDVPEPVNFQVPFFSHPYFFELLLRAQWMAFIKLRFEVSGICYFEVLVIAHDAPQGKHKIKMFTARKPRCWGFKLFSMCGISGMFYDFVFYEVCRPKLRLEDDGIWTCGTKRSNELRGCPLMSEQALNVKWYDNRCVTLTSSYLGVKAVKLKNL
ncbi:hypothetical protein T08_13506 [Trichinella sp. T8]|nr:hypothetical protein T08_13506 [Trichinella sp. T8]